MESKRDPNSLINETSPYLLQHAYNPVNWFAWNERTLAKAKKENKLILVSIGYSACHWCHVMERESFEDEQVAELMNEHYVCIKVDREERPDIDQVYMNAVQLMTGHGGWPLNCIALPDGSPIYGGTYFPKIQWQQVLLTVANLFKTEPGKARDYADELTNALRLSEESIEHKKENAFSIELLHESVRNWNVLMDHEEGGPARAPKFPLPNNYLFLLRYAFLLKDPKIMDHVNLTLVKMAHGGIYDQVGGGFARYSTDHLWKVPHFEKMLYDNAQLVSLYSEAYTATKNEYYKEIVYETLTFIGREMTNEEGAFFSALDADSEGVEGKFYVWKEEELKTLWGVDFPVLSDYYNIHEEGLWEYGNYILLRKQTDEELSKKHNLSISTLKEIVEKGKSILLKERTKRVRPGLDDKTLTSWNALMVKGYVAAYTAFGDQKFLAAAVTNLRFILNKQKRKDGNLYHSYKNGQSAINGFLEDYAFTIEALIDLYQATFEEEWLNAGLELMTYVKAHFFDTNSELFFFTSDLDPALVVRKKEITDNVIPASNSSIANSLFLLGRYFDKEEFIQLSSGMLKRMSKFIGDYGSGYSNWALLMLNFTQPFYEVAISGKEALIKKEELNQFYLPNKLICGSTVRSKLPLLEDKPVNTDTLLYVCQNKTCGLPIKTAKEAIQQMQ